MGLGNAGSVHRTCTAEISSIRIRVAPQIVVSKITHSTYQLRVFFGDPDCFLLTNYKNCFRSTIGSAFDL